MKLTDIEIAQLLVNAGFADPITGVAVVLAESGGKPNAQNSIGNTPPSTDRGLWQINSYWHAKCPDECAYDPACSTEYAKSISRGGSDYHAWTVYNKGAHKKYLERAQAAINAVLSEKPLAAVVSALRAEVPTVPVIEVNVGTALYKYAQSRNFGPANTSEHSIVIDGVSYQWQAFDQAIAYCVTGNSNVIWHIPRPL